MFPTISTTTAAPANPCRRDDTSHTVPLAPESSTLFTRSIHRPTGVESWVLARGAAPVQQSFYYTHPSFSDEGRFLWLGCGFPPLGGKQVRQTLGVVDFVADELRVCADARFTSSRPWIDLATGTAYWCDHYEIWRLGPLATDTATRVGAVAPDLIPGRLEQLATHPTFSADHKSFNLDARIIGQDGGVVSYLGDMPVNGGAFRVWQAFEDRTCNHALFSPVDPNLQLFAHEYWHDQDRAGVPFDGSTPYHRMWLLRRDGQAEPLLEAPVTHGGHEWWSADGRHIWYLHYGVGVKKVSLATREETLVWAGNLSHAHASRDGRYLVADRMDNPSNAECNVLFFDTRTGREIEIVNRPPLSANAVRCVHLHPHPQFCLHDRYICYTTWVHDRVDVALVSVEDLIARIA